MNHKTIKTYFKTKFNSRKILMCLVIQLLEVSHGFNFVRKRFFIIGMHAFIEQSWHRLTFFTARCSSLCSLN